MSLSMYVILGIKVDKEKLETKVKRYDEITGEPYEKTVKEQIEVINIHGEKYQLPEGWDDYLLDDLKVISSYDYKMLGLKLDDGYELREVEISVNDLRQYTANFKASLQKSKIFTNDQIENICESAIVHIMFDS